MPDDKREPQSYGSQADWVTGKTGQEVHDPKSTPPPEHADFYESRHDGEESAPDQGGKTPDAQVADSASTAGSVDDDQGSAPRVTAKETGAKRDSFFRKRDYE
jgi:hypothetical protein